LLLTATEDRLHQEYREPAMPESLALVHKLRAGGLAAIVSGAGPTVAVLGGHQDESAGESAGRSPGTAGRNTLFRGTPDAPDGWTKYELGIDPVGVQVWSMEAG
jgi:homoserine kinase